MRLNGCVPSGFIREISGNKIDFSWPVTVNKLLLNGKFDLILSIGQVVPHEVTGMANYNKNILIGTGGAESINKSHFLGAVFGMEKLMGRTDNPVRQLLNYATEKFAADLPIIYILTVVARGEDNKLKVIIGGVQLKNRYYYRITEPCNFEQTKRTDNGCKKNVLFKETGNFYIFKKEQLDKKHILDCKKDEIDIIFNTPDIDINTEQDLRDIERAIYEL